MSENILALAERLVRDALVPTFKRLHPERSGWNLSLVNVAVTNMAETANDTKDSEGRNISRMFSRQDDVLKEWKVADVDVAPDSPERDHPISEGVHFDAKSNDVEVASWESDEEAEEALHVCDLCGIPVPSFALVAHERYHVMPA